MSMKADLHQRHSQEIELKLALPSSEPSTLLARLARTPLLARRKSTRQHLNNVYYDTPEHFLREHRAALRIRRKGSQAKPQWLQTLKMGGQGDSALSQRGEWETPIAGDALQLDLLNATPWSRLDPQGTVFNALAPCFVTEFDRTSWSVRRRDGSVVEVALDVGQVAAGDRTAPICELELELLSGQPQALFDVAQQLAGSVALLPLSLSKSERGYALAKGTLNAPLRAQPPLLPPRLSLPELASVLLREMFCQFTSNLHALRVSDDPELVHQARVGWRRFRSAWRLFSPSLGSETVPTWEPLQPLLTFIGELRDMDVALSETLPPLAQAYVAEDSERARDWQALVLALQSGAKLQRKSVRYALEDPAVGVCLLAVTQWLEALPGTAPAGDAPDAESTRLRPWARRRVDRLHEKLKLALKDSDTPENQHRARILAKRVRYGIEALRPLLPKKLTQRRYKNATSLQTRIGAARDFMQAGAIASKLEADRGLVQFLRGLAIGREQRQ